MPKLPTILVAGADDLHRQLLDPFPPARCRVLHARTPAEVLDHAVEASVVIVDSGAHEAGVDLCRRLRADPVTTHVPLILRVQSRGEHVQALSDRRVLQRDLEGLLKAIRQLCPDLDQARVAGAAHPPNDEPAPDERYFDDSPTTVLFRRPEAEPGQAAGWPPPPPERDESHHLLEFAQIYSGYINSLLEAIEQPGKLSEPELRRLHRMVDLTIEGTDQHLAALQTGITEALVGKDLDSMKVLSSAKNSIYAKLQQLRALAPKLPGDDTAVDEAPLLEASPAAPLRPGGSQAALGAVKKSELTLAAEAKRAKAAQRGGGNAERAQRPLGTAPSSSVRRPSPAEPQGTSRTLLLALVVIAVAAGIYLFLVRRPPPSTDQVPQANQPPAMRVVQIDQVPSAIVARAEADDREHDPIVFSFRWRVNGRDVVGEKTARLPRDFYNEGDTVQVEIRPADGHQAGAPLLSSPLQVRPMAQPSAFADPDAGGPTPDRRTPPPG